ncbi:MAG: AAA family ATPase [Acidimicrobiaceae bacterium]|nr:AAA family ATPase [Acidimicrobiaceae bacterium]
MAKLTKIIRSGEPVSETEANAVFELLVPIVERDPSAKAAAETAGDVIRRCSLAEDRHLSHVLDWWYVVTTGRSSANSGAHLLPDGIDHDVKRCMEAVIGLDVRLPAAAWLGKRQDLEPQVAELDKALTLDEHGAVKLPGERPVWTWLCDQLSPAVESLRANRRASHVDVDDKKLKQELRDNGLEPGSRRYVEMIKRCKKATDEVKRIVALQHEVEPWIRRPTLELIDEVPSEFQHAVGPLAAALLRPILAPNAAPDVDRKVLAERIDAAGRVADKKGRYRLARVADSWCEQTGQTVTSLEEDMDRHRKLVEESKRLEEKLDASTDAIDDVELHVLEDDLEGAEKVLSGLREQISQRERAERARRQHEGLRRKLRESSLSEDRAWVDRVTEIAARLDGADPQELIREIGAAQQDLSDRLDEMLHEQQENLMQLLEPFQDLRADSEFREWQQRIDELERRQGRGASELKREIEEDLRRLREDCRAGLERRLSLIDETLTDEREDFDEEDIDDFDRRYAEIESRRQEPELADKQLAEARESTNKLWHDIEDRRIYRWQAEHGEGELIEHLLDYCRGPLDFDPVDIRRLYVSLKTRPFVILAGLTGSGKSSLTRTFAEAFGANSSNRQFRRVAVRPDWIDQTEVLGFVNPISQHFVPGWLAETVRDCERQPDRLHFVLLDEMNLAPVEQYLAEWLSAIEEARSGSEDVRMPLYSPSLTPKNADDWPASLKFPDNLMIVGTVNVDETTRPLSERVLDRANVLLLNVEVSDRHHEPDAELSGPWHVATAEWREVCATQPSGQRHDILIDIADILRPASIGVGLRAHLELERFIANADGVIDDVEALDWGIVQRIIPKIRGFKGHLTESLTELLEEFEKVGAEQSASILRRWLDDQVSDDEFLEGTDPRLALVRI